jgi:hypothetical protein
MFGFGSGALEIWLRGWNQKIVDTELAIREYLEEVG